jgi:hypothetical protein
MKVRTSGTLRRIDLQPALACIPALLAEWAELRFDRSGMMLNPLTGEPQRAFKLVAGRHRRPGARYEVTTEAPVYDLPEHLKAGFNLEWQRLRREGVGFSSPESENLLRRQREASVQVGTTTSTIVATLTHDDGKRLAASVTEPGGFWTVDASFIRERQPALSLDEGRLDLTTMLRKNAVPGCLARLLGGVGAGRANLDLAALDGHGGPLLVADARVSRFRGNVTANVRPARRDWQVAATLTVKARGLARPVLWIFGKRLRRTLDEAFDTFWTDSPRRIDELEDTLRKLSADADQAGGLGDLIRRELWTPTPAASARDTDPDHSRSVRRRSAR